MTALTRVWMLFSKKVRKNLAHFDLCAKKHVLLYYAIVNLLQIVHFVMELMRTWERSLKDSTYYWINWTRLFLLLYRNKCLKFYVLFLLKYNLCSFFFIILTTNMVEYFKIDTIYSCFSSRNRLSTHQKFDFYYKNFFLLIFVKLW